jgi:hypothetical protein
MHKTKDLALLNNRWKGLPVYDEVCTSGENTGSSRVTDLGSLT